MAAAAADVGIVAGNFWDTIIAAGGSSMGGSSSALPASPGQQSPALPCSNGAAATPAGAATACGGGMQAPLSPSLLLLNSPAVSGGKRALTARRTYRCIVCVAGQFFLELPCCSV
jgi:hypothetical protein